MKISFSNGTIQLQKELNDLDTFTLSFLKHLDDHHIPYVLMSGYVALLFGRNRSSEDVDLFLQHIPLSTFQELWSSLSKEFECINSSTADDAYNDYLSTQHALRFSKKGTFIPNMEIKFPKVELDSWTLQHALLVRLNEHTLKIAPLEQQIAFKLFLGSEKDIEDARYLHTLLKEHLDRNVLAHFNRKLKVEEQYERYLR